MSRSRHELRDWEIDRSYPFQVALLADGVRYQFDNVLFLSHKLGCSALGFHIYSDGEHYNIYCFPTESAAEVFLKAFDGVWITPRQRKKDTWHSRWRRNRVNMQCLPSDI